jgi:HAE1 family hydrophobic/amphiphilic exporter-1
VSQATPLLPPRSRRRFAKSILPTRRFFTRAHVSTLPPWQLDEYGETLMAQRISMVDGVAQVRVFGWQK